MSSDAGSGLLPRLSRSGASPFADSLNSFSACSFDIYSNPATAWSDLSFAFMASSIATLALSVMYRVSGNFSFTALNAAFRFMNTARYAPMKPRATERVTAVNRLVTLLSHRFLNAAFAKYE